LELSGSPARRRVLARAKAGRAQILAELYLIGWEFVTIFLFSLMGLFGYN
jgi:hypothetical protein